MYFLLATTYKNTCMESEGRNKYWTLNGKQPGALLKMGLISTWYTIEGWVLRAFCVIKDSTN